jgi:hypothetical protein
MKGFAGESTHHFVLTGIMTTASSVGANCLRSRVIINEGYSTENAHHWICKDCFADFREQFEWTVVECSS